MKTALRSFGLLLPLLFQQGQARANVDITLVPGEQPDLIDVRVRPDADFSGLFAGIVFTIRWNCNSGANLGGITQSSLAGEMLGVIHSGPEQVSGNYRYQIYAGFGFTLLSDIPAVLYGGQEFTLATIQVLNASDDFFIVNDAWTAANNGDFFVSLNGVDNTGEIYDLSTGVHQGVDPAQRLAVWPSPVRSQATIGLDAGAGNDVHLALLDAAGREVWRRDLGNAQGVQRLPLDMSSFTTGAYVLRYSDGTLQRSLRVVKQ